MKTTNFLILCLCFLALNAFTNERSKIDLNKNWRVKSFPSDEKLGIESFLNEDSSDWYHGDMPKQVQEFIFENGELPDPSVGDNAELWTAVFKKDWIYVKEFITPDTHNNVVLCFDGLDTEVEVFLNGKKISYCNNMHRRWRIPVSGNLNPAGEENTLVMRFYQPGKVIDEFKQKYPETGVQSIKYIRKCGSDFKSYMGADPPFLKVGIFDDVYLDLVPASHFKNIQVQSFLNEDYSVADLRINTGLESMNDISLEYQLLDNEGNEITKGQTKNSQLSLRIEDPELWYPMNYGEQPIYTIRLKLWENDQLLDRESVEFGIRDLQIVQKDEESGKSLFCVQVNGRKIFMNGVCWAPLKGFTHVWDEAKADSLLRMMVNGNMNFLRVWGEGSIPGNSLFEFCDRNGIVIMMDFMFSAPLRLPTKIPSFSENINKEIEDVIKRLRNHPSIAFWNGGNEQYLSHKSHLGDNTEPIGREFYQKTIPSIVEKLDPQRYFHPSSPWGGDDWINGNYPLSGDYHDYSTYRFQPLSSVPLFTTEVCMVSPYSLHNMRKFMSEDELWPEGFEFSVDFPGKKAWPAGWEHHSLGSAWQKIGRIQDYCDIESAEDACRVFGMAHGQYLKERYERQRRGVPDGSPDGFRRSWGAAVWRLNDTWPIIYMSIVDYYLEPKIPYYFLKRACEPLLISFEQTEDKICVWVTNDTPETIKDSLKLELMTFEGKVKRRASRYIELQPSESKRIIDLTDEFYEIWKRREFIVARLDNQVKTHLLWPEKYLRLPKGIIKAEQKTDVLILESDKFIKSIELQIPGATGAVFSDNYFNLVPGQEKRVSIIDGKNGKQIRIKGLNSDAVLLSLKK